MAKPFPIKEHGYPPYYAYNEEDYLALEAENKRLRDILSEIEKFGHSDGHGRGFTCANIAKQALEVSDAP